MTKLILAEAITNARKNIAPSGRITKVRPLPGVSETNSGISVVPRRVMTNLIQASTVKDTGQTCPKCGGLLVELRGDFGPFMACENYPTCLTTTSGVAFPVRLTKRPEEVE